jgi:hypothetical protein
MWILPKILLTAIRNAAFTTTILARKLLSFHRSFYGQWWLPCPMFTIIARRRTSITLSSFPWMTLCAISWNLRLQDACWTDRTNLGVKVQLLKFLPCHDIEETPQGGLQSRMARRWANPYGWALSSPILLLEPDKWWKLTMAGQRRHPDQEGKVHTAPG